MDKSANQQISKSKITLQMLSDVMAENSGRSKTATELFVRNFFAIIKDALLKDNIVKIKGLGTFKMVVVNARESVNVNTGERVSIAEYNKITFTPDKALKDRINQPFAQFETFELEEEDLPIIESSASKPSSAPLAPESEQPVATAQTAQTEKEIPAPVQDIAEKEPTLQSEASSEPAAAELPSLKEPESQEETDILESKTETQDNTPNLNPQTVETENNRETENTDTETQTITNPQPSAPTAPRNIWKILFFILLGLILISGAYYLGRNDVLKLNLTPHPTAQPAPAQPKEQDLKTTENDSVNISEEKEKATLLQETDSIRQLRQAAESYPQVEGGRYLICGIKAYRKIKPDFPIRRYCMRLYGNTEPMEYILKLNNLQTADVPAGRIIKFPILLEK